MLLYPLQRNVREPLRAKREREKRMAEQPQPGWKRADLQVLRELLEEVPDRRGGLRGARS